MIDIVEAQYERVAQGIDVLADVIKDGNCVSNKLHEVAERQAEVAERQVAVAERQVTVAEKQLYIAEKELIVLQQSRPRHYSESDVWSMLTELGVLDPYRMQCYQFLCQNDKKK